MLEEEVFFPFPYMRAQQKDLVSDVCSALSLRKHLICHAPTGLGKTVSALAPAISFALKESKTVFFLTPKISQHQIAVDMVAKMVAQFKLNLAAVDLVGKKYMCSDPLLGSTDFEGFYHVCSKRVKKEQCPYYGNAVGYSKPEQDVSRLYLQKARQLHGPVKTHFELKEIAQSMVGSDGERPMCAYEVSHFIARESQVIIGDYFHVFNPATQKATFARLAKKLEDSILIVDEAHNLADRVRKTLGVSLSTFSLKNACDELEKLNQPELKEKCKTLQKALLALAKKKVSSGASEALVSKDALSEFVLGLGDLESFSKELSTQGVEYLEASNRTRSNILSVSRFLEKWESDVPATVRIIKRLSNSTDVLLSLEALDPSVITAPVFEKAHSSILMSGTLLPTQMYASVLGVPEERAVLKEYGSPFPSENHLKLMVTDVTTKYTKRNASEFEKIATHIANIVNNVPGNSAVFFPSFAVLESVAVFLSGKIPREVIKQKPKMTSSERTIQLTRFRNASRSFGAVMLGVSNGSYAEGLDYPGNDLLCAVIVGIPLQEMTLLNSCLVDYFEEKFGRGWHYGYLYPAMTKAIQASGRVIRDPSDKGVSVFIDERFSWPNFSSSFPKDFSIIKTNEPAPYVKKFWAENVF